MNKKTLIVSFAGHGLGYGGIPKVEFVNFLTKHFSSHDAQYYLDEHCRCYHNGIKGLSTNVEETVEYLKTRFEGYDRVICIGASAGGYAAILFGSLLKVNTVIAFTPPTILNGEDKDKLYCNLNAHINPTTKYYIYGDEKIQDKTSPHHINHCINVEQHSSVKVIRRRGVNLKFMRYSGELAQIFSGILEGQQVEHGLLK
jgi:hypothetical protein